MSGGVEGAGEGPRGEVRRMGEVAAEGEAGDARRGAEPRHRRRSAADRG